MAKLKSTRKSKKASEAAVATKRKTKKKAKKKKATGKRGAGKGTESTPLTRLAEEVARQAEQTSFLALGKATGIDRRKLTTFAEGDDVPFTMSELARLDEYLSARGRGVAAAFSPPGIIRQLAEHGNTMFIIGSQPREAENRIDFSRWDIRTLREVLQAMNETGRTARFDFEDVISLKKTEDPLKKFGRGARVPSNEKWYHSLDDGGPSVVCIGSPKASHAAEVMLARMMKVDPFEAWPDGKDRPFGFVWSQEDVRASHDSAFRMTPADLIGKSGVTDDFMAGLKDKAGSRCGLFDGQLRDACRYDRAKTKPLKTWSTYGLIAAQRRPGNQLWVVVAGVTGPATLGTGQAIRRLIADLPPNEEGDGCSNVVWAPVKVNVSARAKDRADQRKIDGGAMLGKRHEWTP